MDALASYGSDEEEEGEVVPSKPPNPSRVPPPLPPHHPHHHNPHHHPHGGLDSPSLHSFPEEIINKITEQIENVVNEHWASSSSSSLPSSPSPSSSARMRTSQDGHNRRNGTSPIKDRKRRLSHEHLHEPLAHHNNHSPSSSLSFDPHSPYPPSAHPRSHSAPASPFRTPATPPLSADSKTRTQNNARSPPNSSLAEHHGNGNTNHGSTSKAHLYCHHYYNGPAIKKVVNVEEWDKVYKKWKSMEDEKAEKLKQKTEEKKKAEMAEASFKPRISKMSDKMVRNHEGIVERMVNRKAETDKKIEQMRKLKDDMIQSSLKTIPSINQQSHSMKRPTGVMEQWTRERDKKLEAMRTRKKDQEEEALKEYFKPKLNSKSLEIISKKEEYGQPVGPRLVEQTKKRNEKIEELRKSNQHSHKPQINPRSKSIKLGAPVHERLYKVGMESLAEKHKFMVDSWDFSYNLRKPLGMEAEPTVPSGYEYGENNNANYYDPSYPADPNNPTDDISWYQTQEQEEQYQQFQQNQQNQQYQQYQQNQQFQQNQLQPQHPSNNNDYYYENEHYQQQEYDEMNPSTPPPMYEQNYNDQQQYYDNDVSQQLEESDHVENQEEANGYDEDLRRMMMEAGFFQSSYARNLNLVDDGEYVQEGYVANPQLASQQPNAAS